MGSRQQRTWGHPASKPTIDDLLASRERMNQTSTEFLKIDLETALTFADIANHSVNDSRR